MKKIYWFLTLFISAYSFAQEKTDTITANRFSFHAQATVVNQNKSGFTAPYTGDNSLLIEHESQTSITSTLYLGARLWKGASVFVNSEIAGGSGLSQVLGLGDATNGETFRVGSTAPKVYLARAYFTQLFKLSEATVFQEDGANQIQERIPTNYFAFTIGKISLADYFDDNSYAKDPRTQFMNWGLMANGAWDYAANTRGYTSGVVLEYVTPKNEFRYNISLLPLMANGNDMNWNVSKQQAQNVEYTRHFKWMKRPGAIRVLGYLNSASMGDYRESIALNPTSPDIISDRQYGRKKYGFGLNAEQKLNSYLGAFARASWNDGANETWAFTEIDRSFSIGLSATGEQWKRSNDRVGLAYLTSGLSNQHKEYLEAGGYGFMLGDGKLNYAWEQVTELYYSAELTKKQLYVTGGYQMIVNPGYNADRKGPVHVFSIRVHLEI